jgi:lysophospholipase L1-like esterase
MGGQRQQRTEQKWVAKETKTTSGDLQERFEEAPAADEIRVLFVGTSQTWGAGARVLGETFVFQAERMWNEKLAGRGKAACMKGGISGQNSSVLRERYSKEWIEFQPDVVVINLGTNDTNMEAFRANLARFVELNGERGIRTVFALEANSIEHRPTSLPQHADMRKVAEEKGVEVIDVHGLLKERYDEGFLWWDFVHPTSFGHRLIAEVITTHVELEPKGQTEAELETEKG